MSRIAIDPNVSIPMPVALVGATVNGRPNFMAVGWISRANAKPPMLAIGLNRRQYTSEGILENKSFSACFPSAGMAEVTDYCGIVSGRDADKSGLFSVYHGRLMTAPMIAECPLCLECRLEHVVEMPTNRLFVGEIVAAYADEAVLKGKVLDYEKLDPLLLTMPDNHYRHLGREAGRAWSDGLRLKERLGGK